MHPKPDPRFLSVTAHDLRGAVGVLDGALKELSRELPKDNPDAAKLYQMMGRSSQRLLLLGDRLSALAKLMDGSNLELTTKVLSNRHTYDLLDNAYAANRNLHRSLTALTSPA